MPAFIATVEGDEGRVGGVYFTPQAIHARKAVCDYWQDGELGGAEVRRAPDLDKYESVGRVPMWEMLCKGWWNECYQCGQHLSDGEQYDDEGNEYYIDVMKVVGDLGAPVFCDENCFNCYEKEQSTKQELKYRCLSDLRGIIETKFGEAVEPIGDIDTAWVNGSGDDMYVHSARMQFVVCEGPADGLIFQIKHDQKSKKESPVRSYSFSQQDEKLLDAFFQKHLGRVLDKVA